jgi:chemotaxis family two-component system response regulator Rcp1
MKSCWRLYMLEILLVEDSASDLRLIREALREMSLNVHLNVVTDGEQAIDYLRRRGTHAAVMRPSLILLDLNLPKVAGEDVLREVKSDDALKSIPVIIFSSSQSPQHIGQAYQMGANGYVCKPQDLEEFLHATQGIVTFWGSLAALPSGAGAAAPRDRTAGSRA